MERPIRTNAGIAAAHFSQDESFYLGRKRPAYFEVCSRCQVPHHSEKERERCQARADAADRRLAEVCSRCQVAHRSEKERERCRKSNAGVHCQHCGGSHK